MSISMRRKVIAIKRKLKHAWPELPEAQLMLACVENAIEDAFLPVNKTSQSNCYRSWNDKVAAIQYLSGEMWHAEVCGMDSNWIREVMYAVANYKHY